MKLQPASVKIFVTARVQILGRETKQGVRTEITDLYWFEENYVHSFKDNSEYTFEIEALEAPQTSVPDATPDERVVWKVEMASGAFWLFSSEKDAQQFASLDKSARMEHLLVTDYNGSTNVMEIRRTPIT